MAVTAWGDLWPGGCLWGFLASGIERALPFLSWEAPYQPRAIFVLTVYLISVLPKLTLEKLCPFQKNDDRRGDRSSKGGEKDLPF